MVSNYVISSLSKRITQLINDHRDQIGANPESAALYPSVISALLELCFFFYTVTPTVASSYSVSRAMLLTSRFMRTHYPDDYKSICGFALDWVNEFIRGSSALKRSSSRSKIPVEVLNVLIASFDFGSGVPVSEGWLLENVVDVDHLEYFSLVCCVYYIKDNPAFSNLKMRIEGKIAAMLAGCHDAARSSHDAHLALDVISCPYLSLGLRRKILRDLRKALGISAMSNAELDADLLEFRRSPWFVQWDSLDIVSMITKKELSAVY